MRMEVFDFIFHFETFGMFLEAGGCVVDVGDGVVGAGVADVGNGVVGDDVGDGDSVGDVDGGSALKSEPPAEMTAASKSGPLLEMLLALVLVLAKSESQLFPRGWYVPWGWRWCW